MGLQLSEAVLSDADRIASVHLAAFDSNILLHAQFPTRSSLEGLHTILSKDARDIIQNGETCGKIVLVVRDPEADNQIIGFAKWDLPTVRKSNSDITWPEGCQQQYLDEYHEKADAVKNRVMGNKPCYRKKCLLLVIPPFKFYFLLDIMLYFGDSSSKCFTHSPPRDKFIVDDSST